jgi:Cu+-exporting ATPase
MDHVDPVDTSNGASSPAKQKDPVCGMDVDPANARYQTHHNGKEYFFCSARCLAKFQANPEVILASAPTPMGSGLVSLGGPARVMPTMGKPAASRAQPPGDDASDTRAQVGPTYVCPMCPEVRQFGPGPCPKCGMALDSESPALPATRREYTCPMHAQIVRAGPGNCPICGMTLEPRTVTVEEDNP